MSKKSSIFAIDFKKISLLTTKKFTIMKEYYVTFFGDVCGVVAADVLFYAKSLRALKPKILDFANQLSGIDLVQVYNCTEDKLHEAHLSSLNFHTI